MNPQDVIKTRRFEDVDTQYDFIAKQIKKNITEDELDPDDRLFDSSHILLADTYGEQIVLRFPFSLVRSPIHQIFRMLQQFLHRLGWG